MNINTNFVHTPNWVNGMKDAEATGSATVVGETGPVTSGKQVQHIQMYNQIRTDMGLPTLDNTTGMSAEEVRENIHSFNTKLNSVLGAFRGKPILFDIYAMMDLMQSVSQKLRNCFREIRNLENQVIQADIRSQADIQRKAAVGAMIAGGVLCGIQVCVTVATTAKSIGQMSKQMSMMKQGGVDVMAEQAKITETVGNNAATDKLVKSLETKYPGSIEDAKASIISEAPDGVCPHEEAAVKLAEGKLKTLNDVLNCETKLDSLKTQEAQLKEEIKTKPNDKELGQKLEQVQAEIKEIGGTKDNHGQLGGLRMELGLEADEPTTSARADQVIKNLGTDANQANTSLLKAKADYVLRQNETAVQTAANEYRAVRAQASNEIADGGKVTAETQQKLEAAEGKFLLARGYQVQTVNKFIGVNSNGAAPYNETINSVKLSSSSMLSDAQDKAVTKSDQILFGRLQAQLTAISAVNQALGQFGQTLVGGIKEIISAAATEIQATQKMHEDQLDQIKDLFQQELSTIQKVFQLFEAVTQKESSSIENILMA